MNDALANMNVAKNAAARARYKLSPWRQGRRQQVKEHGLSPQEGNALKLLAAGMTNKEAADALGISIKTFEKYRDKVYDVICTPNRKPRTAVTLAHYCLARGLAENLFKEDTVTA